MLPTIAILYGLTYGLIPGVSVRDRTTDLDGVRYTPVIRDGFRDPAEELEKLTQLRLRIEKDIADLDKAQLPTEEKKLTKKKLDDLILKYEQDVKALKEAREKRR